MTPSYSIIIVTFVMFSSMISGLSSVHRLGIRSASISQSNSEHLSTSSNKAPLSRYGRRGLFREQQPRPGVKCDGTFYKQARVEAVATKACRDAANPNADVGKRNPLSRIFKRPRPALPAPQFFPQEKEKLTMIRITKEFFSFQRLGTFLRLGKRDYVVFASNCRSVGVVRQLSPTHYLICKGVNGGNPEYTPPYI